jgi:peptidoglycan/LPS O-acetylase OafA/YrhL
MGLGYSFVFVGGRNAVQLFYIISGFLISYILNNSKSYNNPAKFYFNRILRLYPIYYAVAAVSLFTFMFVNPLFWDVFKNIPFDARAFLVCANTLVFGQDWVMFSGIDQGHLVFLTNFRSSEVPLYEGLLVPQGWTLGVELSFYLIAPFVLRDYKKMGILLIASMTLRLGLIISGIGLKDPWTYRFFPTELALFLIGGFSQQYLLPFWKRVANKTWPTIPSWATLFLITFSLIYFLIPLKDVYRTLILFALFVPLLPLTFMYQDQHRFDKAIGDLSYPIYIGHMLVIMVTGRVFNRMYNVSGFLRAMIILVFTIVFAYLLDRYIAKRVEKYRQMVKYGYPAPLTMEIHTKPIQEINSCSTKL